MSKASFVTKLCIEKSLFGCENAVQVQAFKWDSKFIVETIHLEQRKLVISQFVTVI